MRLKTFARAADDAPRAATYRLTVPSRLDREGSGRRGKTSAVDDAHDMSKIAHAPVDRAGAAAGNHGSHAHIGRMTLARVAMGFAIVCGCAVIVFAFAPADAAVSPGCTLAPGQILPCVTTPECIPFGAVCDPLVGICACPITSDAGEEVADAGELADAAERDAASSDGGRSVTTGTNTGAGGLNRPITHGCDYAGR